MQLSNKHQTLLDVTLGACSLRAVKGVIKLSVNAAKQMHSAETVVILVENVLWHGCKNVDLVEPHYTAL